MTTVTSRTGGWLIRAPRGIAVLGICVFFCMVVPVRAQTTRSPDSDSLEKFAADFWAWRARYQPFTGDDVPRIEHPAGIRDWSGPAVANRGRDLAHFESRFAKFSTAGWRIPEKLDYRLLSSALARVRWELQINPRWKRDPNFYIEQSVTPILECIAIPGPYDGSRSREILERIRNIPSIITAAEANLDVIPASFAQAAIDSLADIRRQMHVMAQTLQPDTTLAESELGAAAEQAGKSLADYRLWLQRQLPSLPRKFAIGRAAFEYFIHKVALLPFSPEELLTLGRLESERAEVFRQLEAHRNASVPPLQMVPDMTAWVRRWAIDERQIREFLQQRAILTVPPWLAHYELRPMPEYVRALSGFGETDDFTSANRLRENAIRYQPPPSPELDFFWQPSSRDPRPILLHEGIPGHYFQLALSWTNKDPIRRHFYDSAVNEGLGFYCEEMMLQSGLFDTSPRTREIVYDFMLLRALGIEVDVRMALGEWSISQAAAFVEQRLPLGHDMAMGGATMFALGPGVLVAYQTGKSQIIRFLADARLKQGNEFDLKRFNDSLWVNGNVPLALQRWEYLGSTDDIRRLDQWNGQSGAHGAAQDASHR